MSPTQPLPWVVACQRPPSRDGGTSGAPRDPGAQLSSPRLPSLQHDWADAGNLHRLLRCDWRLGVQLLCSAVWVSGKDICRCVGRLVAACVAAQGHRLNPHLTWGVGGGPRPTCCVVKLPGPWVSAGAVGGKPRDSLGQRLALPPGHRHLPHAPALRGVPVYRAPTQPAEEHDGLHPVLQRHGPHLLHRVHVRGECWAASCLPRMTGR